MAKQYEDQAKAIESALQPTGGQKEAYASGGLTPLQLDNAKIVAKVAAENNARTPEQKLYAQAVDQGFKGTELDFQAERERLKGGNFKLIGMDQNGYGVHGFIDPKNRKAYDINGNPIDTTKLTGFGNDGANSNLTGDAFLATLDPGRANDIRAIAEGRMAPPGSMALGKPQIQQLMREVGQYEPGFNLTTWQARVNGLKDFYGGGKSSETVRKLNQSALHFGELVDKMQDLPGTQIPGVNRVANAVNTQLRGKDAENNFIVNGHALADELAGLFKGAGISDSEIRAWESKLSPNMSAEQQRGMAKTLLGLYRDSMAALEEKRQAALGPTLAARHAPILSAKADTALTHVEKFVGGQKPSAQTTAPTAPEEGATATNQATGERLILRGGQWVPMK
jgi:hypothetical protein